MNESQYQEVVNDINHDIGQDLHLSSLNDISHSSGLSRSQQRVLRRLLTNPGDYIWHSNYGAGLAKYIGQSLNSDRFDEIKSTIISQIFLEDSVSKDVQPEIFIQTIQGGVFIQINYVESVSKNPIVLSFNL
jgi:phage baseplate assembly protein W